MLSAVVGIRSLCFHSLFPFSPGGNLAQTGDMDGDGESVLVISAVISGPLRMLFFTQSADVLCPVSFLAQFHAQSISFQNLRALLFPLQSISSQLRLLVVGIRYQFPFFLC